MKTRFALIVLLALVAVFANAEGKKKKTENRGPMTEIQTPEGGVLAWVRFDDASQEYAGTKYLFLGDGALELTIDVKPAPGHALALRWGGKRDARSAVAEINGVAVPIVGKEDYDGFQWLTVAIPAGVQGGRYDVVLRGDENGRAAFLAEVRLIEVGGRRLEAGGTNNQGLKAAVSRITLKKRPAAAKAGGKARDTSGYLWKLGREDVGEGFPQMRALWDREPAAGEGGDARKNERKLALQTDLWRQAERNARQAAEAYYRCHAFTAGWLKYCDPKTGLFPRNLMESRDFWNGRDSAADNYPFMVLTAALTDRPLFEGRMLEILKTEKRLTSRIGNLCDNYSFSKQGWARPEVQLDDLIFDSTEYVKDGLIPLTEWLGASPWSERMIGLIDDVWANAPVDTPRGKIPTLNFEVNGDLLQACTRLYWFTGDRKYLDWAIRLGDYYLLGDKHPTRTMDSLRLSDHACEMFNGLSELYVAVSKTDPKKREAYRAPLREIYDRILAIGRDEHGMLYSSIDPKTGTHTSGLTDCWGYNYDGIYTMYLVDGIAEYREAVRKVLGNLKEHYTGQRWQDGSADGYADSIEGAINLFNREPMAGAADWIDGEIRVMWGKQHPDGIIEGWHGDGNFARTSIMYALWKTQGVRVEPWRADVRVGAAADGEGIAISLAADRPWSGRLIFDTARHKTNMKLPMDYPRINQFPEWFTVEAGKKYRVIDVNTNKDAVIEGARLSAGRDTELKGGEELRIRVEPVK